MLLLFFFYLVKERGIIIKTIEEIRNILAHATGSESYHKYSCIPGYPVITDNVLILAEGAECFWFLDVIGSHQNNRKLDKSFQVWKLIVDTESESAVVQAYNDTTLIITQAISHTDFPLEELKLYLIDGVILLPSEY